MDAHAQHEIRSYATVIGNEIVSKWCPLSWEAFKDYRLNSVRLSRIEAYVLKQLMNNNFKEAKEHLLSLNLLSVEAGRIKLGREVKEMNTKFRNFGIEVDWDSGQ